MKKLLLIFLATIALGCESKHQSTDQGAGSELERQAPVDPAESDTSSIHQDTTTTGGMNTQGQYDTVR